jgi:energy-coupling factor transport system ATP-binding protein
VRVRGLSVRRGKREVLRDVSFEVGRGDFVAVLGANGAGKTTLVQAIAGVVRPPRGTVGVGGVDPARASVSALTEAVGFVFQNPEHQFVTHTVADELGYGLRLRNTPEPEVAERVDRMLATLGLLAHRDAHPFLLSGGQKRRLSVGTALIAGAPVLVLDEPTFGQDRERATELLSILADLNRAATTVIIVTHDLQLVAEYASHVAILADGRLAAFGETADVLADSDTLRRSGLRSPPLAQAFAGLSAHPDWQRVTRLADLPDALPTTSPHDRRRP